ncbi:MAG: CapA family protein [Patescibacteria group bacterium]
MNKDLFLRLFICVGVVLTIIVLAIFFQVDQELIIESSVKKPEVEDHIDLTSGFLIEEKQEEPIITLLAVGDIMLSRTVAQKIKEYQDYKYPFLKTAELIKQADIAFGNLEGPITQGRSINIFEMIFRADIKTVEGLKYAGFDILSLANNHSFDFGAQGLKDTFQYLNKSGINYVGAGENRQEARHSKILEINGIKIAFLAYTDSIFTSTTCQAKQDQSGVVFMEISEMEKDIVLAKSLSDLVVVLMHSGTEYADQPNSKQISFAHTAIDAGADLVIGHHPHVIQKIEKYKGKYVFYSLGNFVFDQMWSRKTREGLIAKIVLDKEEIREIILIPVLIENYGQPRILDSREVQDILKKLDTPFQWQEVFYWDDRYYQEKNEGYVYSTTKKGKFTHQEVDLDNDGQVEKVILDQGKVQILKSDKIIWQSDPAWQVDNLVLADLNYDGRPEINMSLWKKGNYGDDLPFWLEENTEEWGNHLFVYGWRKGKIEPFWCSSTLDAPIKEMVTGDVNGDGKLELMTLEGNYEDLGNDWAEYLAIWSWDDWGFFNDYRSDEGRYHNLFIRDENNDGVSDIVLLNFYEE